MEFLALAARPELADFNLVIPSLPGYGWSEAPKRPGVDTVAAAQLFVHLMTESLGYTRYFVQGGDWGGIIATTIGQIDATRCLGLHLNFFPLVPTPWMALVGRHFLSPEDNDKAGYPPQKLLGTIMSISGYMHEQATKPDTLGVALSESPVALAAWVLEKFHGWSGCLGELRGCLSTTELITNLNFYWLSGSTTSSLRFYKESLTSNRVWASLFSKVRVPVGLLDTPYEMVRAPLAFARAKFSDIVQYSTPAQGGHFFALEQPEALAKDLALFVHRVLARPAGPSGEKDL